jgi:CopG-like RHH_1 or ribbon-helix-helix domain, RHH_5
MNPPKKERKPLPIMVHVNFSRELIAWVDKHADSEDRTRSNMIQVLVKRGLEATEAGQR